MTILDVDQAFECFKKLIGSIKLPLSEADTRAKVIDPIFMDCLGWDKEDITREEHVNRGFIDYTFKIGNKVVFILEAKKIGSSFIIPLALRKPRYKISGSISTDSKIKEAIDQVQRYCAESGSRFAVVSNGEQFIIFEAFKPFGKWRDGFCLLFRSLEDIVDNFTSFWNILSKEAIISGSLRKFVSRKVTPLEFWRPLDTTRNEDASSGKNILASHVTPLMRYIFKDLTDDSKIEMLRKCYVRQRHMGRTDSIIKLSFDRMPHYAKQFDINWFRESPTDAGGFQVSFDKCREFLRIQTPVGSTIILLGGIGSGKTTFIHHFFKVVMEDRKDILWFNVDFGKSPPALDKIEEFVYDSIVQGYKERYRTRLEDYLKSVGMSSIRSDGQSILMFFTILRYKGYTISIVLDNVDQHSYTSPKYQERVFELAQNLTHNFKTITILTLREESFFRSTRSGVLDAYPIPKFHVESPGFKELIRSRINYTLDFLEKDTKEIVKITKSPFTNWEIVRLFLTVVKNSIRKDRRVGLDILKFMNDISGGDMRQALRFFRTFLTSGNTNISEMLAIELNVPPKSPPSFHYQIPLHHIIKSIVLGDYRYYTSSHSHVMNVYQVNPQYTNSHFIHLRILDYLHKRINFYTSLDKGLVDISQILDEAETAGISQKTIEYSLKKLAEYGLVEFDNQSKKGYETAEFARITTTGKYYLENLCHNFAYLDLVLADTLVCDPKTVKQLRERLAFRHPKRIMKRFSHDYITELKKIPLDPFEAKKERMKVRFARTETFLGYLKKMEEDEFKNNPGLLYSDLTQTQFMEKILAEYSKQMNYIRTALNM